MSAEDLAIFLREKMGRQRITNTEMVRRTGISRRTWYRLLNADIEEAKLSTLIKLSNALDISVTQLVHLYFNKQPLKVRSEKRPLVHTNLPSNSLIEKNQQFTKTWEIKNTSKEHWEDLTLNCIDESLDAHIFNVDAQSAFESSILKPSQSNIAVENTKIGETASLSVNFIAPSKLGATMSHWRFYKNGELLQGEPFPTLNCLVKVVES